MPIILLDLIEEQSDKEAFEAIYYEYRQLLFYVANMILHDEGDAEDAVIEAFIRLASNFKKTNKKVCHETRNYAVIIVRNVALDMIAKRTAVPVDDIEVLVDNRESHVDSVFDEASYSEICSAINDMPDAYSDILYLYYIDGFSIKEIAGSLKLNESAIRKRLERGRILLKKRYK